MQDTQLEEAGQAKKSEKPENLEKKPEECGVLEKNED